MSGDCLSVVFQADRGAFLRVMLEFFVFDGDRNTRNVAPAEPCQPSLGFAPRVMNAQDLD